MALKVFPALKGLSAVKKAGTKNNTLLQGLVDGFCFLFDRSHSPPGNWGLALVSGPWALGDRGFPLHFLAAIHSSESSASVDSVLL